MFRMFLFISAIIVFLFGCFSFIFTLIKTKKIKENLLTFYEKANFKKKKNRRRGEGFISFDAYEKLCPLLKENQLDFLLNAIHSNDYKEIIFFVEKDYLPIFEIYKWLNIKVKVVQKLSDKVSLQKTEFFFNKNIKDVTKSQEVSEEENIAYELIYVEGAKDSNLKEILEKVNLKRQHLFLFITKSFRDFKAVRKILNSIKRRFIVISGTKKTIKIFLGFTKR